MADEFKHKAVGPELTQAEWEALGGHEADSQVANDMLYYNGTTWIRATKATILSLLNLNTLIDNSVADALHRHSELSASDGTPGRIVYCDTNGILYADGAPKGLDVLYSAEIGTHLTVRNNIIVFGTVDGVDIAARDHAKYLDSEAIVAAKTVMLDDFTAPDDNTDLNSSTTRHGLLKKLDNVATNFMNGQGNWVAGGGGGATKEFFVPVTIAGNGGSMTGLFNRSVAILNGADERAYIDFFAPADFSSITSAVVVVYPTATQGAADWDTYSDYAAIGEAHNIHSESNTASTYNVTDDQFFEVDISGILSSLAAGDYVGIRLRQGTVGHDVNIIGIRFKYS